MDMYWFDISKREIPDLVEDLDNLDDEERRQAELALFAKGKQAEPALINALDNSDKVIATEAAMLLGDIHDEHSAPALVEALKDQNPKVRQQAAASLIFLRVDAVVPIMQALAADSTSAELRKGAYLVLQGLEQYGVLRTANIKVEEAIKADATPAEIQKLAKKALS